MVLKMEFGPKDAVCNHPLIILAVNSRAEYKVET